MFIFEKAPFPSCHASTLVEHEAGKLMAAWFGGKAEGAKDVEIWASTFDGKAWSEPKVLATEPGYPCWNPVLFKSAKGTLHFWYKAGPKPDNWTGYTRTSVDSGKTWTKPEMMPCTFLGPVRKADSARERHHSCGNLVGEFPELVAIRGPFHGRRQDLDAIEPVSRTGEVQPDSADAV